MDPSQTKVSGQQLLAKKYIEENDIERIVSEMLNSLAHERVRQPLVYMIKFLAGLMTEEERASNGLVIPEPFPKGKPIAKFPYLTTSSLLQKYLTKELFAEIKYLKTKSGGNINDIIKLSHTMPDDKIGCSITDGDCIETFKSLLTPIINEFHNVQNFEFAKSDTMVTNSSFPFKDGTSKQINKFAIEISRNIKETPYVNICSVDKLEYIEGEISKEIKSLIDSKNLPTLKYMKYSHETDEKWNEILKLINYDDELMTKTQKKQHWPNHRSIFYNDELSLLFLINFSEHLTIYSIYNKEKMKNPIDFPKMFNSISEYEKILSGKLVFDYDSKFGYINSDIKLIGTGMKLSSLFTVDIRENNVEDFTKKINKVIKNLKFDACKTEVVSNKMSITCSSSYKLSMISSQNFIEQFYNDISGLIHLNPSLSFTVHQFAPNFNPNDTDIKKAYEETFDIEKNEISSSGLNINDAIGYYVAHPGNKYGLFLEDYSELKSFNSFISKYLTLSQGFNRKDFFTSIAPQNATFSQNIRAQIEHVHICLIRNIDGLPFANSRFNENKAVEELITTSLNKLNLREHFGNYFSLEVENQKDQATKIIEENNLNFYDESLQITNRGVIQFDYENVYALVNDIDHIKFYLDVKKPGEKFNDYLFNVLKVLNEFGKQVKFSNDKRFGVVTSCPKYLGTGIEVRITIKVKMYKEAIEKIIKEANEKLVNDTKIKMFSYELVDDSIEGRTICLKNNITMGKSENQILADTVYFVNYVLEREKTNNEEEEKKE